MRVCVGVTVWAVTREPGHPAGPTCGRRWWRRQDGVEVCSCTGYGCRMKFVNEPCLAELVRTGLNTLYYVVPDLIEYLFISRIPLKTTWYPT